MTNQNLTLRELLQFVDDLNKQIAQQAPSKSKRLLTRKEVAEILNISLPTLHEWTITGKISGYRIGTRVLYKPDEVFASLIKINSSKMKGGNHGI